MGTHFSFEFAKDKTNQNANCFMISLDVDSVFTNDPLHETIKICIDELFKSEMAVSGQKRLVGYTLISSVFFHLSISLVWYTPY